MIAWTIYLTFAGAVLLLFLPRVFARWIALATIAGLALGTIVFVGTPIARSGAFYNDRARAVGPGARDELPPRARWRQSDDGSCHRHFSGKHGAVFVGCGTSAERIFFLASAGGGRVLRRVPQRGSVFAVRVLRAGDRAEIFSHRDLRLDQQGIRRDEADAVFLLRRHVRVRRNTGRLRQCRVAGPESARRSSNFHRNCNRGRFRCCFSALLCWPASGRCTPGRRLVMPLRRLRVRCCSREL